MFDVNQKQMQNEVSKDDIVKVGNVSQMIQPIDTNHQTLEHQDASSARSASSPAKSVLSEQQKVQSLLFKKMLSIVEKADRKNTKTLSELESINFSRILREESIRAQMTSKQCMMLKKKVLKTLEELMNSLMLQDDFKAIQESLRKAANADQAEKRVRNVAQSQLDARENERLIKLLLRCVKMFEAKERTMKILMRAKARDELKLNLME